MKNLISIVDVVLYNKQTSSALTFSVKARLASRSQHGGRAITLTLMEQLCSLVMHDNH